MACKKRGKEKRRGAEGETYLIHNLNSTSQPFIFTQILLMPSIQLPNHCRHPALLTGRCKHDPGSRHFFVGNTPAANESDRNIIDELARIFEETTLNFDRGYLRAGDFESILEVKVLSLIFLDTTTALSQKLTFTRSAYLKDEQKKMNHV